MLELKFLEIITEHYKYNRCVELNNLYQCCVSIYSKNNTHMGNILNILQKYQTEDGKNITDDDSKLERAIMRNFFMQKSPGCTDLSIASQDEAVDILNKRISQEARELQKYIKDKILIKTRKEFLDKNRCIDIQKVNESKKYTNSIKLRFLNNDSSRFDVSFKIIIKGNKTGKASFSVGTSFSNAFSSNGEKISSPSEVKILNLI